MKQTIAESDDMFYSTLRVKKFRFVPIGSSKNDLFVDGCWLTLRTRSSVIGWGRHVFVCAWDILKTCIMKCIGISYEWIWTVIEMSTARVVAFSIVLWWSGVQNKSADCFPIHRVNRVPNQKVNKKLIKRGFKKAECLMNISEGLISCLLVIIKIVFSVRHRSFIAWCVNWNQP